MDASTIQTLSTCQILEIFPLDFAPDSSQEDKDLIVNCVKVYKDLNISGQPFNFLELREIFLISEFFTRYGQQIRLAILNFNFYFELHR